MCSGYSSSDVTVRIPESIPSLHVHLVQREKKEKHKLYTLLVVQIEVSHGFSSTVRTVLCVST